MPAARISHTVRIATVKKGCARLRENGEVRSVPVDVACDNPTVGCDGDVAPDREADREYGRDLHGTDIRQRSQPDPVIFPGTLAALPAAGPSCLIVRLLRSRLVFH